MNESTNPTPIPPGDPWQVAQAREVLAASKTAETTDCARWWGRCEATLESLLDYIDKAGR